MRALLEQIFGVGRLSEEAYQKVYAYIKRLIYFVIALAVLATILNVVGLRAVNIWLGCSVVLVIGLAAIHLRAAEVILGIGFITSPTSPIDRSGEVAKKWLEFISSVLLYVSIFLLVMGTMPMGVQAFKLVPTALFAIFVLVMISVVWKITLKIIKRVTYVYACAALVISILMLIPASVHQRVFGGDPVGFFRVSPVDKAFVQLREAEEERQQKADVKTINDLVGKIKDGPLSEEDLIKLQNVVERNPSLMSQTGNSISQLTSLIPTSSPQRAERVAEERLVSFQANEKVDTGLLVRSGDTVELRSMTAPVSVKRFNGEMKQYTEPHSLEIGSDGNFILYGGKTQGSVRVIVIPGS